MDVMLDIFELQPELHLHEEHTFRHIQKGIDIQKQEEKERAHIESKLINHRIDEQSKTLYKLRNKTKKVIADQAFRHLFQEDVNKQELKLRNRMNDTWKEFKKRNEKKFGVLEFEEDIKQLEKKWANKLNLNIDDDHAQEINQENDSSFTNDTLSDLGSTEDLINFDSE